jgi:hypothetical protein
VLQKVVLLAETPTADTDKKNRNALKCILAVRTTKAQPEDQLQTANMGEASTCSTMPVLSEHATLTGRMADRSRLPLRPLVFPYLPRQNPGDFNGRGNKY